VTGYQDQEKRYYVLENEQIMLLVKQKGFNEPTMTIHVSYVDDNFLYWVIEGKIKAIAE